MRTKQEHSNKFIPIKIKMRTEKSSFHITKETNWEKGKDNFLEKEIIITETIKQKDVLENGTVSFYIYDSNVEVQLSKRRGQQSIFLSDGEIEGAYFYLSRQQLKIIFNILKKEKFV